MRRPFSNRPQIHSRVLENPAPAQTPHNQLFGKDSHFSYRNYGYYCFLI